MIRYYKLFDMLQRRDMKLSDLRPYIASTSLTKLKKGAIVQTDVINKICWLLKCQPSDIMEYVSVPDEKIFTTIDKMKMAFEAGLGYYDGKSDEEVKQQSPVSKNTRKKAKETAEKIDKL